MSVTVVKNKKIYCDTHGDSEALFIQNKDQMMCRTCYLENVVGYLKEKNIKYTLDSHGVPCITDPKITPEESLKILQVGVERPAKESEVPSSMVDGMKKSGLV